MKKYFITFNPKCPPYQMEDEWQVGFNIKSNIPCIYIVKVFKLKIDAIEYCNKLNKGDV